MIDRTCVTYITNGDGSKRGSGLVICTDGSAMLYVLTCQHVVEGVDPIHLLLVTEGESGPGDYDSVDLSVPRSQVRFGVSDFDVAVICADASGLGIKPVPIRFGYAGDEAPLKVLGYPFEYEESKSLVSLQEELELLPVGSAKSDSLLGASVAGAQYSDINLHDAIEGLSGSPVYYEDEEGFPIICGLLSRLQSHGRLGRVSYARISIADAVLRESFGMYMEHALGFERGTWRPQAQDTPAKDGAVAVYSPFEVDSWLKAITATAVGLVNSLQLRAATETARSAISDARFPQCATNLRAKVYKVLSFCYRISKMHDEAYEALDELERLGVERGQSHLERAFNALESGDIQTARYYAKEASSDDPHNVVAKLYLCECDLFESESPDASLLSQFIDGHEELVYTMDSPKDESLIYQQIGWLYATVFKDMPRAMRCLRRAYGIDGNLVVCETLACVERDYALMDAVAEDGSIIEPAIDRAYLSLSREHFIKVLTAADDMYMQSFLFRSSPIAMQTFSLCGDAYRVMWLYGRIREWGRTEELAWLPDIEMMAAATEARSGVVSLEDYPSLETWQQEWAKTLAGFWGLSRKVDCLAELSNQGGIEKEASSVLNALDHVKMVLPVHLIPQAIVLQMNLLLRCVALFSWDVKDSLSVLLAELRNHPSSCADVVEAMETALVELDDPVEAERRYRERFDENETLESWMELRGHFIRRHDIEAVARCYKDLFENHRNLCDAEPEMIARSYMEFALENEHDLSNAMRVLADLGGAFADPDLLAYWTSDVSLRSTSFNDPDAIEENYRDLMKKGLVTKEEYRHVVFAAYVANLEFEEASEFLPDGPIDPTRDAVALHYLAGTGHFVPLGPVVDMRGMNALAARWMWSRQEMGLWESDAKRVARRLNLDVSREIVIDAWGIYQLYENGGLVLLDQLDTCWITHSSVMRLLNELAYRRFESLANTLDFIKRAKMVRIMSPGQEAQLEVRQAVPYYEPMSTIALALERRCLAVVGADDVDEQTMAFKNVIIRPCKLAALLSDAS